MHILVVVERNPTMFYPRVRFDRLAGLAHAESEHRVSALPPQQPPEND